MQPTIRETALPSVREASRTDIPAIAEIHQQAFQGAFLTRLGRGFLRRYYELVHEYERGILVVADGAAGLDGFAAGFLNPFEFYRRMRSHSRRFAVPLAVAVVRDPFLLWRVTYNAYRVRRGPDAKPGACELSSIAVSPDRTGRGLGKALVESFLRRAWDAGAEYAELTTDAERNEPVNTFYRRLGFELHSSFVQYGGRRMNEYVLRSPCMEATARRAS